MVRKVLFVIVIHILNNTRTKQISYRKIQMENYMYEEEGEKR